MVRLGEVVQAVHAAYDPRWAEPWDAVGLVCGDPQDDVRRILLAVDPTPVVAREAVEWGAALLLTHHPLYLGGTATVAADSAKGSVVHQLIRGGAGLLVAHTNADVARPGVSDALAAAVGLAGTEALRPAAADALDKVVVFVPEAEAQRVIDAMADAGAGALGDYERCAWVGSGVGTFIPTEGADPAIGRVGERSEVPEQRVEMVLSRARRGAVLRAMVAAHPYEEPAYDVLELGALPGPRGLGRVGDLEHPMPLRELTAHIARVLPRTSAGVRSAGDPGRLVRRLAVCGGSGGDLAAEAARAGAQALLTADLRHHVASEAVADHDIALVDAAHWATERPWLDALATELVDWLGTTVETRVSTAVTDPWTTHAPASDAEGPE